jgi:hypothetical protein
METWSGRLNVLGKRRVKERRDEIRLDEGNEIKDGWGGKVSLEFGVFWSIEYFFIF